MKLFICLVTIQVFGYCLCQDGASECRPLGSTYTGNKSITASGKVCQRWDANTPHEPYFFGVENYCRNPDNTVSGPWCYTMDANKRWETCNIPVCEAPPAECACQSELDGLRSELEGKLSELSTKLTTLETTVSQGSSTGQLNSSPNGSFYTLKNYEGWKLVFKASAGIQKSVLDTWKNKGCSSIAINALYVEPCDHYKSPIVENWVAHGIKKVLVVLAKDGVEVKRFEFNGEGSDKMNWFDFNKLLQSSYTDLTTKPQYFSMEGHGVFSRRFFIHHNYGGCKKDAGWLCVIDAEDRSCAWEKGDHFPRFIYSPGTTFGVYQTGSQSITGRADVMAIFVQT